MSQLDAIFDLMGKNKLSNRNLKESVEDGKAIAGLPLDNFGGIEILDIKNDIDDYAVVRYQDGTTEECQILYDDEGEPFIYCMETEYPLNQFMRYEACGSDKKKKDDKKEEILNEKEDLKEGWYEDFSDYRKIPINDPITMKCIESVIGQLSDGIWENSPRMESYWGMARTDDNNLYIYDKGDKFDRYKLNAGYKNPWTRNGFAGMTDSQVKQWFAKKIREIIRLEAKDAKEYDGDYKTDFSFKPDNETTLDYFHDGITVGDAYKAYQELIRG